MVTAGVIDREEVAAAHHKITSFPVHVVHSRHNKRVTLIVRCNHTIESVVKRLLAEDISAMSTISYLVVQGQDHYLGRGQTLADYGIHKECTLCVLNKYEMLVSQSTGPFADLVWSATEKKLADKLPTSAPLLIGLPAPDAEQMEKVFAKFDLDNNGTINALEFQSVLAELGHTISQPQAATLVRKADRDGDQEIDYDEFIRVTETLAAARQRKIGY